MFKVHNKWTRSCKTIQNDVETVNIEQTSFTDIPAAVCFGHNKFYSTRFALLFAIQPIKFIHL